MKPSTVKTGENEQCTVNATCTTPLKASTKVTRGTKRYISSVKYEVKKTKQKKKTKRQTLAQVLVKLPAFFESLTQALTISD